MSDIDERPLGDLIVRIDRHLCVGFGDCIDVAPEVFEFDDEGIVVVKGGVTAAERERLVAACESCPVDALTLHLPTGEQIAP